MLKNAVVLAFTVGALLVGCTDKTTTAAFKNPLTGIECSPDPGTMGEEELPPGGTGGGSGGTGGGTEAIEKKGTAVTECPGPDENGKGETHPCKCDAYMCCEDPTGGDKDDGDGGGSGTGGGGSGHTGENCPPKGGGGGGGGGGSGSGGGGGSGKVE